MMAKIANCTTATREFLPLGSRLLLVAYSSIRPRFWQARQFVKRAALDGGGGAGRGAKFSRLAGVRPGDREKLS